MFSNNRKKKGFNTDSINSNTKKTSTKTNKKTPTKKQPPKLVLILSKSSGRKM